jgi:hypothetical protein
MGTVAAAAMKITGSVLEMEGHRAAGEAARITGQRRNVAAQFEAQQLEQQAGQTVAAQQRVALEEKRKANLVASRALAVAGASGAGATDPSVVNIIAGIKGEGAYRAAVALYRGEDQARKLRMGAKARRYEGAMLEEAGVREESAHEIAGTAALFSAGASFLKPTTPLDDGTSTLNSNYGGGGWQDAGSMPISPSYG